MLPEKILKDIIKKYKLCSTKDLNVTAKKAEKNNRTLEDTLVSETILDETDLYEKAGKFLDIPFIGLKGKEIKKDILNLIPGPVAGTHQVVAFDKEKDSIKLAMADPTDIQTIEFLRRKTGLEPKIYITTPSDIKESLRLFHSELEDDLQIIQEATGSEGNKELKKAAEELPIINIANTILEHAVYEGASDIHIEPYEKQVIVRYRIDGLLKQVMT